MQCFSTESAPAEPPTPTLPEPFLVKHAGPLLLTPLAILAVIVAFLLLVPMFSEREYVALVSQTFGHGACVSADSTNTSITTLAPYAASIESIIRSNDGPNFRRTFWVLSASDAAELSSLLRSLCTAHPTGVVYLKITNATTFARDLGHAFSFVFQDEDSSSYSMIRRVFTDAYGTAEPLYSMKNFFSVLKKGAVAFKGSTGRVPVLIIDGFDQLRSDEKSLSYVQRLAHDTAEAGSMIVVFAASDPRVITQLKERHASISTLQLA